MRAGTFPSPVPSSTASVCDVCSRAGPISRRASRKASIRSGARLPSAGGAQVSGAPKRAESESLAASMPSARLATWRTPYQPDAPRPRTRTTTKPQPTPQPTNHFLAVPAMRPPFLPCSAVRPSPRRSRRVCSPLRRGRIRVADPRHDTDYILVRTKRNTASPRPGAVPLGKGNHGATVHFHDEGPRRRSSRPAARSSRGSGCRSTRAPRSASSA